MRTSWINRVLLLALVLVLACPLLAGCQPATQKTEKANADWSRGEALGKAAINSTVAFALDAAQENIYQVWVTEQEQRGPEHLHLVRLDRAGHVVSEGNLPIEVNRPTQVELVSEPSGGLHLTWMDRLEDTIQLFHARLDVAGQLISQPEVLSLPEVTVVGYALAVGPTGEIEVFWSARESKPGLYHLRLNGAGEVIAENRHLGRAGFGPDLRIDRGGIIHLVWEEEPSPGDRHLYYATFERDSRTLKDPVSLTSFPVTTGLIADRPTLGLGGNDVYVFWSRERRGGGLTPPSAESYYLTFPIGKPESVSKPQQVNIPATSHPAYTRMTTPFRVQELAVSQEAGSPSEFIYQPSTVQGHYEELVAAFAVQIGTRTSQATQIVLTVWSEGKLKGYQVASKSRVGSMRPVLLEDARQDLHLAWIDVAGFGVYETYYAGTSAEARANLNRLTTADVVASVFNVLWGVVQAISFFPIILVWIFVPLVVILIYSFLRVEGDLKRTGPRVMLWVSVLLYTAFKYLFRPNWLAALPLPSNLSAGLADALIYAAPVLISVLAGVVMVVYTRKREYPSLLPSFGFFVAFDALLTLLIYVPGIVAE